MKEEIESSGGVKWIAQGRFLWLHDRIFELVFFMPYAQLLIAIPDYFCCIYNQPHFSQEESKV